MRTTHTIPAGEIGNEKPIVIVTEVWTSPDLKTVVYSKRSDPRMGEQIFKLTNITRAEPDASLFTVPRILELPTAHKTSSTKCTNRHKKEHCSASARTGALAFSLPAIVNS